MRKFLLFILPIFILPLANGSVTAAPKGVTKAAPKKSSENNKKPVQKKKATPSQPHLLGTYGNWRTYTSEENGNKVCYMTSFADKETGQYNKRGDVYLLIAHRPYLKSYNVVSFDAGYTFKKGDQVDVKVQSGKKEEAYRLFTDKETAWCADPKSDKKLTMAITKGEKIIVSGASSRGTKTRDVYSLKGSKAAYLAICRACGVKAE